MDVEKIPLPEPDTLSDAQLASICARMAAIEDSWVNGLNLADPEAVFLIGWLEQSRQILRRKLDDRLIAAFGRQ